MRELPMLLNGEMVRATLAGTKTQTRRPVKPQPVCILGAQMGVLPPGSVAMWHGWPHRVGPGGARPARNLLGAPGDLLYVREKFAIECPYGPASGCDNADHIIYWATEIVRDSIVARWRPSIHMPEWAARLWVRNTGVRVERVQDITEEDVIAEGVRRVEEIDLDRDQYKVCFESDAGRSSCPFEAYAWLWDSIYAKRGLGWDSNCWAWVTSYEVTER